jgi:hypothetical protein
MIQEFKEFALRGNVVDMAVGVVIGARIGKIVTSPLTNDCADASDRLLTGWKGHLESSPFRSRTDRATYPHGRRPIQSTARHQRPISTFANRRLPADLPAREGDEHGLIQNRRRPAAGRRRAPTGRGCSLEIRDALRRLSPR